MTFPKTVTRRAVGAFVALLAFTFPVVSQAAQALSLNGAGATFPQPLYEKWFFEYNKKNPDVQINYQGIGSGGGIKQITAKTVDFGASDAAMTDAELAKAPGKILMLPMTAGAIAVTYNVPGIPSGLKLGTAILPAIFLGKITKWNDPAIAAANPGVNLPDQGIAVVRRSDGSGTTFIFTNHLSTTSPVWKVKVGTGKDVKWPTGLGAKGNAGVAAQVQQTPGAIGYVEFAYAAENNLPVAALENNAGKYILPSVEAATESLAGVKYPDNFRVFIGDPAGVKAYPIVGLTWLLVYEKMDNADKAKALGKFVDWALTDGQQYVKPLKYTPLPAALAKRVMQAADVLK
jgi:phosphate transport system substrate-binding protein